MRIGFFADEYLPRIDGVITSMNNLAKGLRAQGHEVYFIVPNYPGAAKDKFVVRLPSTPVPLSDNVRAMLPSQGSVSAIRRLNLDIIHSHTPFVAAQLARRMAKDQQLPHVTTFHTLLPVLLDYYPLRTRSYLPAVVATIADILTSADLKKYRLPADAEQIGFKRQAWKWTGAFLDSVDHVISPSEHFAAKLRALGADTPVSVVPNSIDLSLFPPRNYRSHRPLRIAAVGRLSPEKRQYELIKALAELKADDFQLVLIGDGPDRRRLEGLIARLGTANIELTGTLPPAEVRRRLYRADVGVLASNGFDNQPMTVLEYLSAGLPVVYCDPELTEGLDSQNSRLSPPSPSAIAKNLSALKPDRLKSMSRAARLSAKRFDIEPITRKFVAIYKSLV